MLDEKASTGSDIDKVVSLNDSTKAESVEDSGIYDKNFERRTMRYVDWRIIPIMSLVYSFSIVDRVNIGSAYTAGMAEDLNLSIGSRFSIISCMYFVVYTILQLPGNLILRYFGVRNWLTFVVVAWGAVQLAMGFVHSWGWLVLCRVLLGVFESSFFPSLLFIISTWYKRHEVQKRLSVFYLIAVSAGGVSPLLAYVLSLLHGKRGLAGWRWIFIIEGAITILSAVLTWIFIPAFPDQNTFLTPKQTELVLKRIDEDRGDARPDPVTWEKVKMHLGDWTLWAYGIIFMCVEMPANAQGFFLPIILKGMGWSTTKALLLSVPPYGPPLIITMIIAHYSDKQKHRVGYIVGSTLVTICGLCLTAFAKQNPVRYFGAYLSNAGISGSIPTLLAYSSNNVVTHSKRSVQTAIIVAHGGIAAIIATTVFRAQDAPKYVPGLIAAILSQIILLALLGILTIHFMRLNKAMREGKRKEPLEGQPGFYYTL